MTPKHSEMPIRHQWNLLPMDDSAVDELTAKLNEIIDQFANAFMDHNDMRELLYRLKETVHGFVGARRFLGTPEVELIEERPGHLKVDIYSSTNTDIWPWSMGTYNGEVVDHV